MNQIHKISFEIASIIINVESEISINELGISNKLTLFQVLESQTNESISLRLLNCNNSNLPIGELIYDPGEVWRMYKHKNIYNAIIFYDNNEPLSILSTNEEWREIEVREMNFSIERKSTINNAVLELILRAVIQFHKGTVFHSVGIDDNGKGLIFSGHSGAGKSTLADLWIGKSGITFLNDDRIAVRETDKGYICYGTPWGGTANIAINHKVPLTAIILIEKSKTNKIEKLSPSEALPLLMVRSFFPYWDEKLAVLAVSNLNSLVSKIPVYRLHCYPGPEVVELVRSVL